MTGAQLYTLAANAYKDEGFEGEANLHHQGGACGYRPRDWVALPACVEEVRANQAFAWNPSITGTKVEETSITFDESTEVITASPAWPSISVTVEGQQFTLPDVLSV
jgi:antitoxin VapB